jgi:hypothetical protein
MTIEFEDAILFDKRAHNRSYGTEYRKTHSRSDEYKKRTKRDYLKRPIIAIDGEGVNIRRGLRKGDHDYILLAMTGQEPLYKEGGLPTKDILDYLWQHLRTDNINVIYGGSYDFNMWMKDLSEDQVRNLYHSSYTSDPVIYAGYGLRWIKGKAFEISRTTRNGNRRTVTINDVISFFQRPFIQACDEYLGSYDGREVLVREKARRGDFRASEIAGIASYNNLELDLLVRLVTELRSRLDSVGLRPRRWNSPGAIASALFERERVKDHRNEQLPDVVMQAARFAYAGGRFEMLHYGAVKERVYEYDINSAYPRALLEVPSLKRGTWKHNHGLHTSHPISPFGLYRVRFTGTNPNIPAPIFHRATNGTISYPLNVENWVWSPEVEALKLYCEQVPGTEWEILEAWEYTPATDHKPFGFIAELYKLRQLLKAAGDGAHIGIKLALNSLYGKLAQQVGWKAPSGKHPLRVPTYHQLEWAGYVTSWCRAHVLRAALHDLDAIIAFETDALFSSRPLPLDTGTALGQWEKTVFTSLTYVQSGHYYGTELKDDGTEKEVIKCRGIDKGFISRENVETLLGRAEPMRVLEARLTRFYGAGIALARGLKAYWCKWLTEPKFMMLMPTGKRLHAGCWCGGHVDEPLELGRWHKTACPVVGGLSSEYPVEWINPNPDMTELAEMRESENFYDD